jgi:hypothetical protein
VLQTVISRGHSPKSAGSPYFDLNCRRSSSRLGAVADLSRELGQRIVSEFRRRIKDLIEGEGGEAIRLVHGHRLEHESLRGTLSLSELNLSWFRVVQMLGAYERLR